MTGPTGTHGQPLVGSGAPAGVTVSATDHDDAIWQALRTVVDPEIPVLDIVEMGIVRSVSRDAAAVTVTLTPTFSACPAIAVIEEEAAAAVRRLGHAVRVVTTFHPPWSSDDMTAAAREKLRRFGIAPSEPHGGLIQIALDAPVRCPHCDHPDTFVRNTFGSTLCREIRSCRSCGETFERFKPI
ncbi:MAG TPA: 1,2-phenylacetyl-CoA epoxidase subunit PaaD [Trueperaceae bacterium]|nr:1,2-phenylacetyl-CoA epoxidase subunit PaaD [Trueperaceae bacterium]